VTQPPHPPQPDRRKTTGFVQITVQNGNRTHNTHVGVSSPRDVADTLARVNFARTLCV
jgi:hypothetical protein